MQLVAKIEIVCTKLLLLLWKIQINSGKINIATRRVDGGFFKNLTIICCKQRNCRGLIGGPQVKEVAETTVPEKGSEACSFVCLLFQQYV